MSDDEEKKSSKPEKESSSSREEHKKHRDDSSRKVEERGRRRHRKRRDDDSDSGSSSSDSDSSDDRRRKRHRKKKHKRRSKSRRKDRKRRKHKHRRRKYSSDSSSSSSDESTSDESKSGQTKKKVVNQRLVQKLAERGETLEEREQRRAERRAARITAQFGYTTQDNPFNDPNIAETFTWKKKNDVKPAAGKKKDQTEIINEIEKVRKRRRDYEEQKEEMERIRAEESRMKELENYDEWAKKEEEFHLLQQRQRSAIRLVEGREKPIDVLAKNLLMFGLSDREKEDRAKVKYQEKYNAFDELENLEAELDEPHVFLKDLKLHELEQLLVDIHSFRMLERDVSGDEENTVTKYWDAIHLVTKAEIHDLKSKENGSPAHRDGDDWWMHAAGCPGSHVVIRAGSLPDAAAELPKEVKLDAAVLAANYSKAALTGNVGVTLCRARQVSKPFGAKPGLVQLSGDVQSVKLNWKREKGRLERLKDAMEG